MFSQHHNLHIYIILLQFSLLAALVLQLWSHSLVHQHHLLYDSISASIIQGSAIGPASYVVDASDLQAVTLCKYADDTYLIIPAVNVDSRSAELHNVNQWALANNLKLNLTKSQEIILQTKDEKQNSQFLIKSHYFNGCKLSKFLASHLPVVCL